MKEYYNNLLRKICSLTVYRNTANDEAIKLIKEICLNEIKNNIDESLVHNLITILINSAEENGYSGNLLKNYILNLFITDENVFSLYCENNMEVKNSTLYSFALNDIKIMKLISSFDISVLSPVIYNKDELFNYKPITDKFNKWFNFINTDDDSETILNSFIKYYNKLGCGNISRYKTFKYDIKLGLIGIKNYDPITFEDIIGYKSQTETLLNNTSAFIKGYPANNVLLVGGRGTGKSSSVKALANKYFEDGLRIIEITKEQIELLPNVLSMLKNRGKKFIIYIDDLSFDEKEAQYKYMKSLLDGGTERKPDNVLFYATSNRRHLIQEKWSDRARGSEEAEIHTTDTLNEKLSLADRFGITITYPKPTPKEYIDIVKGIAKRENLDIDDNILEKEAMKWEINQKGMSGRTAKQFINNLIWQINIKNC